MAQFRIFISSTFRDLTVERGLLRDVFDDLRKVCRSRGHDLHVVDLRWGISDEVQRQGRTMQVCLEEVARCQSVSPRPNFLILLGDRYGWEPAPDCIERSEFEQLRAVLDAPGQGLLDNYYGTDENAVPCVRVLDRGRLGAEEEAQIVATLRSACRSLDWHEADERRPKYECSATHQEILLGTRSDLDTAPESHVFATVRDRAASTDTDAEPLADLESRLEQCLGASNLLRYPAGTGLSERGPADRESFQAWVKTKYLAVLEEEMDRLDQEANARRGDGEGDRHKDIARRKSSVFVGRAHEAATIQEQLRAGAGSIRVTGVGGAGKSAFMGRVFSGQSPGSEGPSESMDAPSPYVAWVVPAEPARDSAHLFGVDGYGNAVEQDKDTIRKTIREILALESPIHVDRLCHRVSIRWGFKSYTKRVKATVGAFLSDPELVRQDGEFCWAPGSEADCVSPRTNSSDWRDGDQVHDAEVRGAIVVLLNRARSEGKASLKRKALRAEAKQIFGITKQSVELGNQTDRILEAFAASLGWTTTQTTVTHHGAITERREAGKVRSLIRFVGETERSSNYVDLLRSIMDELLPGRIGGHPAATGEATALLDDWRTALEQAGAIGPIRIYLDGVDQLRGAPANAAAIVPLEIPKGVQFVISSTPAGLPFLPRQYDQTVVLPSFDPRHTREVLRAWLTDAGRCLQEPQEASVLERCEVIEDGHALFIRLIAGATAGWRSTHPLVPQALSDWASLDGILGSELQRLDGLHTSSICSHMTRHCAVSRRGLTEDELQGSLLALPGFWSSFVEQQHMDHRADLDAGRRVPDAVISLVLSDLRGVYLKERGGHFQPAHRLVGEFVLQDEQARVAAAKAVAQSFAVEPWFFEQSGAGHATANSRKVVELPHALSLAGQHGELLSECLANLDCLVAAVVAGELEALFEVEIPESHALSERALALRARLRAAPETILARRRAVEVEDYLRGELAVRVANADRGARGLITPVPRLERIGEAEVVDMDLESGRVLLWDAERSELQERCLETGSIRSTEAALAGALARGDGPNSRQVVVELSGAIRCRSQTEDREIAPGPLAFGALAAPIVNLGGGRVLCVHKVSGRNARGFEVRYHDSMAQTSLQPLHSATVTTLAASPGAMNGGGILVASGGRDRRLCVWRLAQEGRAVEHLHERKFDGQVAHVQFAGPDCLLVFCRDETSRGAKYSHEETYDLFRLDLNGPHEEWQHRWVQLHQGIHTWAVPAQHEEDSVAAEHVWMIDASGVVELSLATSDVAPIYALESPASARLDMVASGVGCVRHERISEEFVQTLVRRGVPAVNLCVLKNPGDATEAPCVVEFRRGTLVCLEQFDLGDSDLVDSFLTLRGAETLEEHSRRHLSAPEHFGALMFERWSSIAVTHDARIEIAAHGVSLDFDQEMVPTGQYVGDAPHNPIRSSHSRELTCLGENAPQLIRRGRRLAAIYPAGRVVLLDEQLRAADVGPLHALHDVRSHQQLLSDAGLTLVEGGSYRTLAPGDSMRREVALPTTVEKCIANGERLALIDSEGGFWLPHAAEGARPRPWRHEDFACLDALAVGPDAWIIATAAALLRVRESGAEEILQRCEATHVELLGGNGAHALCRVDGVLYDVTDLSCTAVSGVTNAGPDLRMSTMGAPTFLMMDRMAQTLRVIRPDGSEVCCIDVGDCALDPQDLEEQLCDIPGGLVFDHPRSGWTVFTFDGDTPVLLAERFAGLQSVRAAGGLPGRPLVVAECHDEDGNRSLRLFDVGAGAPVDGVPTEVDGLWVAQTRVAWCRQGELATGQLVNGRVIEPVVLVDGLADVEVEVSWSSDTFHVFDAGLCWTSAGRDDVLMGPAPYTGPVYVHDPDGQAVVRHLSGFTSVDGGEWQRRFAPVSQLIGLTLDHENLVCVEGEECVVRRIATDEAIARFTLPLCDSEKITFTPDLMIFEEAAGVLTCRRPVEGCPTLGDAIAPDDPVPNQTSGASAESAPSHPWDARQASGAERWMALHGLDPDTGVVMASPKQRTTPVFDPSRPNRPQQTEHLLDWGYPSLSPAALVTPNGEVSTVDPFEHLVMQAGALPALATGRTLTALGADGNRIELEIPADWWASWPQNMELPGPDVRLKLDGGAVDWRRDVSRSGPVEIPPGWYCTQALGVGHPLVLRRRDEIAGGGSRSNQALYDPAQQRLHELKNGAWTFFARKEGGVLAIRAELVMVDEWLEEGPARTLFMSSAADPANLERVLDFEVPADAYSDLEYDAWRECFWYMTSDSRLHAVGAEGAAPGQLLKQIHDLPIGRWGDGIPREMLGNRSPRELARIFEGFTIHCLPDELLIVRGNMPPASQLVAWDVTTKTERCLRGLSEDYEFCGFQWVRGRRMLAYLEDVRRPMKRTMHVAMLVELGHSSLEIGAPACLTTSQHNVHILQAHVAVLHCLDARNVLQLLSADDLELIREITLPAGSTVLSVTQAEQSLFLLGDCWAGTIDLETSEPPRFVHWSPLPVTADHEGLGAPRLPGSLGYHIGFRGRAQASWDGAGCLLGWGDLTTPSCSPSGVPLCCLALGDGSLLVGGENGEVTQVRADGVKTLQLLTEQNESGEPKKGWQILGLYRAPRNRVAALYRNGVVLVLEPSSGDLVYSWEPRNKNGTVHPEKHVVHVEESAQLFMWLGERHAKVMELGTGLVWNVDMGEGDGETLSGPLSTREDTTELVIQRSGGTISCIQVSRSGVATGATLPPRSTVAGSAVPIVPGKSWHATVHTDDGLTAGDRIVPIKYERGLWIAGDKRGTVWARLSRKRKTWLRVYDVEGTLLMEWGSSSETVAKQRAIGFGGKLERLPLAVSPGGVLAALLLEEGGGMHARIFTTLGHREWRLDTVQDLWFVDDRSCLAVTADGALERIEFASDDDACKRVRLTPPIAESAWSLGGRRSLIRDNKAERLRLYQQGELIHDRIHPIRKTDCMALTPCRRFVAIGSSGGVISIFKVEDGTSCPLLLFPDQPEWKQLQVSPGRVWGLTVEGRLETQDWAIW